jgi:hypothetical protein
MVTELLNEWGISGFMDHVATVEEFYRSRRDRMQQAAEKHLGGKISDLPVYPIVVCSKAGLPDVSSQNGKKYTKKT